MLMLMLMLCQHLRIASAGGIGGIGLSFLVRFQANGRQLSCRTAEFPQLSNNVSAAAGFGLADTCPRCSLGFWATAQKLGQVETSFRASRAKPGGPIIMSRDSAKGFNQSPSLHWPRTELPRQRQPVAQNFAVGFKSQFRRVALLGKMAQARPFHSLRCGRVQSAAASKFEM